jgi:hypothetical protein
MSCSTIHEKFSDGGGIKFVPTAVRKVHNLYENPEAGNIVVQKVEADECD